MTDETDDEPDIQLDEALRGNTQDFASGLRLGLAAELGQTGFNDDEATARNHYEVFGWPRDVIDGWDEDNWLALYLRNAYARIVVEKPAFTTWRDAPEIVDPGSDADEASDFERSCEKLAKNHRVWSYCERADRAAGIGQHGLLLIGFSDVVGGDTATGALENWQDDARDKDFSQLSDITGFKPILGAQIEDIDYGDPDSERWDLPVEYTIDLGEDVDSETEDDSHGTIQVHWSRVIDIPATRPLDDETLARPRVEPVLNNILDIQKILGAAAEAGYRAADYGLHLNADPTKVDMSGGMDDLENELQAYEQDLQRYLRTSGVEVERLGGDIQDPSGIVENNLDAIAGQTGIPKKEFRGNESGEVSGAEADERSYFGMISERREQYATPHIVRQLIDRLQAIGILPNAAAGEYRVEWPDLVTLSADDQADIEAKRAQVIQAVPGLAGDTAMQYLKDGVEALPEMDDEGLEANFDVDEDDAAVQETFGSSMDLRAATAERGETDLSAEDVEAFAEWLVANFDPIKHPRDPETGKFVERPYPVPDEIADLGTEQVIGELAATNDNFAEQVEDLAVDIETDDDGPNVPTRIQEMIDDPDAGSGGSVDDIELVSDPSQLQAGNTLRINGKLGEIQDVNDTNDGRLSSVVVQHPETGTEVYQNPRATRAGSNQPSLKQIETPGGDFSVDGVDTDRVEPDGEVKGTVQINRVMNSDYGPKVGIDTPFEAKEAIKSTDFEETHRSWDSDIGAWTADADSISTIRDALVENGFAVETTSDVASVLSQ